MTHRSFFCVLGMIVSILIGQVVSHADATSANELRLRLSSPIDDASINLGGETLEKTTSADYRIAVVGKRPVSGTPPRQRNPKLSPHHLVVVAFDMHGQEITRIVIPDPRIVRAETFDPSGHVTSSQIFYRSITEFLVILPDDHRITGLKIFQPHWTGSDFILKLLGETKLP